MEFQSVAIFMLLLSDLTSSYIFDEQAAENDEQIVILPLQGLNLFQFGKRRVATH